MTTNYDFFNKKYSAIWGKNTLEKLLKKQKEISKKFYIRINTSKTSLDSIEKFLKNNRVKYNYTSLPNCIEIKKSFFNLSSSPQFLLGEMYIQDFASQIPIHCINWESFEKQTNKPLKILDMASSPGSKATQIADILDSFSIPYSFTLLEPETKRLTKLINNLQKQTITNIEIYNQKGEDFYTSDKFDIVLLDAPCSGNIIDENNWLKKRNQQGIEQKAKLQRNLLKQAYNLVEKEGIILYSTCSMEVEENEMNANWFVKTYNVEIINSNLELPFKTTPIQIYNNKRFHKDIQKTLRIMPLESNTQAFYVAIFKK